MIERGEGLDLDPGVALKAVLPNADVLVDYLVVAAAVQNQDRNVEIARECDLVARVEVIVVGGGRAVKYCAVASCARRFRRPGARGPRDPWASPVPGIAFAGR